MEGIVDIDICRVTGGRSRRASSWDRSGRNTDCILVDPGATAVLVDIKGPGIIRHIYMTMIDPDPLDFREAVLRIYWDGAPQPAVEVPLGDFFCISNCTVRTLSSALVAVNPGSHHPYSNVGINAYFPMPFASSARIEIVNESSRILGGIFGRLWYHIDYEELASPPHSEYGRFHAFWNRRNPTPKVEHTDRFPANLTGEDNYVMLKTEATGHVAGFLLQVDNIQGGWYGEGDDMIFVDDDTWPPSIHGTGTEEIFGGGAGPDTEYASLYTGFHLVENADGVTYRGKNAMYRWYVPDPIRFQHSIRMTIEHGHANDFANDYSSVVYWYQVGEGTVLPRLPEAAARHPRFPESFWKAHAAYEKALAGFVPQWQVIFEESPVPAFLNDMVRILETANDAFRDRQYEKALSLSNAASEILKSNK